MYYQETNVQATTNNPLGLKLNNLKGIYPLPLFFLFFKNYCSFRQTNYFGFIQFFDVYFEIICELFIHTNGLIHSSSFSIVNAHLREDVIGDNLA